MALRLANLLETVDARFAAAGTPAWPDPHPDGRQPGDAEYSRLSDPGRYVTVQERCRAWIDVTVEAGLATTRSTRGELAGWGHVDTVELVPAAAGAVGMFVHFTGDHLPGVVLALGDPFATVAAVPVCGCDACDEGSESYLDEVDNGFTSVLLGRAVVEITPTMQRIELIDRTSSGSRDPGEANLGRWAGSSWLDP